jgi:hypothetical protein
MFKPGKAVVPSNGSGTAPDAAATPGGVEVSFDAGPNRLRQATLGVFVTNREAAGGNTLEVSFNNAGSWYVVATDTSLYMPVVIHRMRLRGTSGATADYSVLGIV